MKDTPHHFEITNADQTFWIAKGVWEWRDKSEDRQVVSLTGRELIEQYVLYCNESLPLSSKIYGRFTDLHFEDDYRNQLVQIVNGGEGGTIDPTGDHEGLGISFVSGEDAIRLADIGSDRFAETIRKVETEREEKNRKHADSIATLLNNHTPIYFHFKQDYAYRGLEETFKGVVKLSDLVRIEQALNRDEDEDELVREVFGRGKIHHSVTELFFGHDCKLVKKLANGKTVKEMNEVGFEAFSLTAKRAKQAVQKMVLEENDLD